MAKVNVFSRETLLQTGCISFVVYLHPKIEKPKTKIKILC